MEPDKDRPWLAVIAHPDDEAYSFAGTLARAAAGGVQVVLAAATRGEAGFDLHTGLEAGPALADKRSGELRASCAALGLDAPRFLDLPDGALEEVGPERGTALLTELLVELQPAVVVGLGADGAYGHRDHLAVQAWLRTALASLPTGDRPRLLEAAFPAGLFAPVHRHLTKKQPDKVTAGPPEAGFGIQRDAADLVIDIRPQAELKLAALAAHRSQARPDGRFILPGVDRLMDEEWFSLEGEPGRNQPAGDLLAVL